MLPAILTALSSLESSLSILHNAFQRQPDKEAFPALLESSCSTFSHSILPYVVWLDWILWVLNLHYLPTRANSSTPTPGFQSLHNKKDQVQHFQVQLEPQTAYVECDSPGLKWSATAIADAPGCLRWRPIQGTVVKNLEIYETCPEALLNMSKHKCAFIILPSSCTRPTENARTRLKASPHMCSKQGFALLEASNLM